MLAGWLAGSLAGWAGWLGGLMAGWATWVGGWMPGCLAKEKLKEQLDNRLEEKL